MKTLYLERSTGSVRDGNWVASLDLDDVERIVVGTGPGSFAGIRAALSFAQGYALGRPCEVLGLPSPCAIAATLNRARPCLGCLAVIGDARRGQLWIALFDGFSLIRDIFQINSSSLAGPVPTSEAGPVPTIGGPVPMSGAGSVPTIGGSVPTSEAGPVPSDCWVVTPDEARIGGLLKAAFGDRYLGGQTPTAEGLKAFAEANPAALVREPLPIYLNPAVRD